MTQITKEDYQRILDLCFMMDQYGNQYRQRILEILAESLGPGFHNLTFLALDSCGRLGNPVAINQVQNLCDSYTQEYNHFDIFAHVLESKATVMEIMSVQDIMCFSEYELTPYYNDFLRKENMYYVLAVPLCYDKRLLGCLGIFRKRKEGDFTLREKEIASIISRHLSLSYHNLLNVNGLQLNPDFSLKKDYEENSLLKLTKTEQKIAYMVECGMTNRAIAKENNISFYTVKAHLEHIYDKLDVHSRTEMIHLLHEKGKPDFVKY